MQPIPRALADDWLRDQGLDLIDENSANHLIVAAFGSAGAKKLWLAWLPFRILDEWNEVMIYVTQWSVWPSSEHLPLFDGYRRGVGCTQGLEEYPAHILTANERDQGVSLLYLGLEFVWDIHVLDSRGRMRFFSSHDEWFALEISDEKLRSEVAKRLLDQGFELLQR